MLYFLFINILAFVLFSRQKQFYFFAKAQNFSILKTFFLIFDGSTLIILNLALLKVALFEEYTIFIFCSEYLKLFKVNYLKLTLTKSSISGLTIHKVFANHYIYVQFISFINKFKVSKVMLAYGITCLPLNIYLLQSVIFKKANTISINLKTTAAFQTIILFTSTLPMCRVYKSIRRPAKYLNALQISSNKQIKLKGKIQIFYEYLTDDFSGKGFSLGSYISIKSSNLLKVINKNIIFVVVNFYLFSVCAHLLWLHHECFHAKQQKYNLNKKK